MAHCAIGYGNLIDTAIVSAGSALVTAPASFLQDPRISKQWRAATNSTFVLADFGSSVSIGAVALVGTNMTAAATRQVRLSSADATGVAGDVHNSGSGAAGVDSRYGMLLYFFPTPLSGRYLRVDMADTSVTALRAGRWAALTVLRPQRNFQFGYEDIFDDPSRVDEADDGTEYVERRPTRRGFAVTLPALTAVERGGAIVDLRRLAGSSTDVLLCLNPESANLGQDSVWGRLRVSASLTGAYLNRFQSARLTILERR